MQQMRNMLNGRVLNYSIIIMLKLAYQLFIKINKMQKTGIDRPPSSLPSSKTLSEAPQAFQLTLDDVIQQKFDEIVSRRQKNRSRSTRRLLKTKTPNQILKENILKNRQSKKVIELKHITEQNLKLFRRLQEQKSRYQFAALHRQSSCLLPVSKSRLTSQRNSINFSQFPQSVMSRCSSLSLFKPKEQNLQKPATNDSNNSTKISMPNVCFMGSKSNKENLQGNLDQKRQFNKNKQEQILVKRIGLKLPLGMNNIEKKKTLFFQKENVDNPLSHRSKETLPQGKRGFLTEQKLQVNV